MRIEIPFLIVLLYGLSCCLDLHVIDCYTVFRSYAIDRCAIFGLCRIDRYDMSIVVLQIAAIDRYTILIVPQYGLLHRFHTS